ncbi:MAG: hypothetical protein IIB77_06595 [Proteobacteria bacterium]|nr:hypothetical protein [Pseudomonadota bacterium]
MTKGLLVSVLLGLSLLANSADDQSTRSGFLNVAGGPVWYRITGSGSGIPLVVLHGGPGTLDSDEYKQATQIFYERHVYGGPRPPGARFEMIEDAAHASLFRQPERSRQVLGDFLRQVEADKAR